MINSAVATHHSGWRTFRRVALRYLLYVGLGLAFAALSAHMPVGEAAKRGLTRSWGPLLTWLYPDSGRENISVMLLDDADLRAYGENWPVSMGFHQRRLQEVLKYRPKAVFIDLIFLDDRNDPDLNAFVDTACQARQAGIPVAIGSFRHVGLESRTQHQLLERTVQVDGHAVACLQEGFLHSKIDGVDQSVWEYELNLEPRGVQAEQHHGGRYLSPAAWLYSQDHVVDEHVLEPEMALIWGTETHPVNLDWINGPDGEAAAGACAGSWGFIDHFKLWGKQPQPLCPYHRTLPLRTLKRTEGFSSAQLNQAINGKYIIYGADLQSTGDIVVSPFHGRMPGAYLHAMALDNLLSFNGAPKRAGEFDASEIFSERASTFILGAIMLISAAIMIRPVWARWLEQHIARSAAPARQARFARRLWAAAGRRGRKVLVKLLDLTVWAVVALGVIWLLFEVSYQWLNLGPLVWIEFVLFPIALDFLDWGEKIAEGLEVLVHELKNGAGDEEEPGELRRQA